MKLNTFFLTVPVTLTLLFAGCSTGSSDDAPVTAPDMGDVSTLAKSGATTYPATELASLSLFKKTLTTIMTQAKTGYKSDSSSSARTSMSYSYKGHIDWTGTGCSVTGPYNVSSECPDFETLWKAEFGSAPNLSAINNMTVDVDLKGTFTDAKVYQSDGYSYYTISGKFVDQSYTQIKMTVKTANDKDPTTEEYTPSYTGTYKYDVIYGAALSVKDSTGTGAKFIVSLYYNKSGDISDTTGSTDATNVGTLKVYDDTDKQLFTIQLAAKDLIIQ